ncbi:MAG: RecQ family ATP-dependent DNA helicase [Spirochaetaceae bacterium]|jgi:ATP-dependent DNA helicase RecQ|nr:RecQ family ATP-dependent DNA helicase [Spirochaetaceae bacterium]
MPELPGFSDPLTGAVRRFFGLSYLFPYQRLVIANILEAAVAAGIPLHWPGDDGGPDPGEAGEDRSCLGRQIVILPTGAGKSLCFQLPAMILSGVTLVIYPLLSLMADQERRLRERGFSPVILRGGQDRDERDRIWGDLRSGKSRFLIANPEVLLTPRVLESLRELKIAHMVIDEAHCVSEWGESFRPDYLRIGEIIQAAGGGEAQEIPLVTAFTATASAPVLEKIGRYIFGGREARRIIGSPDRSNISYAAQGCVLRDPAVRDLIIRNPRPAIVFCSSRPGTEQLARYLRNELAVQPRPGVSIGVQDIRFYHAGLSREEKAKIEGWFFQSRGGILAATCAYGMGVDKADIRTVIHRDCPPSVEAYLQESGRAGRDGLRSRAILLWGPDDERVLKRAKSGADRERLARLIAYARNIRLCRRGALLELLNYEEQGGRPESECCDVCGGTAREIPREEPGLMEFFRKNRRVYTIAQAAAVLSRAEALGWSEADAKRAIDHLIGNNKLRRIKNFLWKDKLTIQQKA